MKRILVIDDKPENLYLLRSLLEGHSYEVVEARHGAEALVLARQSPPDMVISDLLMPVMDGYTLLRHWRADARLKAIPFIVYTATYTEAQDEKLALELGADAYIIKPAEPEQFMARLRSVMMPSTWANRFPATHIVPEEHGVSHLYSEVLIRKLEEKRTQLEQELAERIAAEGKAQLAQQLHSDLVATIDGIVWEATAATFQFTFVSPQAERILGYPVTQWLNSPDFWAKHIHADDRDQALQFCLASTARLENHAFDYRMLAADGRTVWLHDAVTVVEEAGRAVKVRGIMVDITERKQAEEALQEHERYLATLVSNLPGMVYRCCNDATRTMIFVSEGCLDLTGYKKDELEQNRIIAYNELVHPDDRDRVLATCLASLDARTPCNNEYRIINRAGETRWVWERSAGLYADNGTLLTIEGFITDITSRKAAEFAKRESEENFRQIAENIHEVFYIFDVAQHRVIYVSPAYEKLYGRSVARLLANPQDWLEAMHPEDRARVAKAVEDHLLHGFFQENYRIIRPDGTILWISDQSYPVRDHTGQITRIVGTAQNITEHRELEQQLRQSQKLEAIGTLAGGIAHDFNNILSGIVGFNSLARKVAADNPELLDYLDQIGRAGHRAAELVKQILAFSRAGDQSLAPVQIRQVVAEAVNLLRATIPTSIGFEVELPPDLPAVLGNATQLHQVVLNLGTNAWHAMRDQPGCLRVRLETCAVDEVEAQRLQEVAPGDFVRLTVADTGCGMDAATRQRIFEPFFTTKAPGEGTGLGLSVVHGIVRAHQGAIRLNSEVGRGTTFEIFLPAIASAPEPIASTQVVQSLGKGEKILFVDDEEPLIRLGEATLRKLGYEVIVEQHVRLALARLQLNPQDFQLVISDQTMPGLTGLEFAERIRSLRADLPIVLASGNSLMLTPEKLQAAGVKDVLAKPYTVEKLAAVVARHLGPSPPA